PVGLRCPAGVMRLAPQERTERPVQLVRVARLPARVRVPTRPHRLAPRADLHESALFAERAKTQRALRLPPPAGVAGAPRLGSDPAQRVLVLPCVVEELREPCDRTARPERLCDRVS